MRTLGSRATVAKVNAALRALGFATDELEFVRGQGYCYIAGSVAAQLEDETGLYGLGACVSHCTVQAWVEAAVRACAHGLRWSEDAALRERVDGACRTLREVAP